MRALNNYTTVIWDWNGTLLNDAQWCLSVINTLLANRGLKMIKDVHAYRDIFGFPVIDYYRRAGFDFGKEPFDVPAAQFIDRYHSDISRFRLFDGAAEVLATANEMGLRQIILSASELNNLRAQVGLFDIEHYFDEIIGISNIYAGSKLTIGQEYVARSGLDTGKTVLIGDTVHDHEVAKALGVECILIPNGHQPKYRLLECGVPVLDDINDLVRVSLSKTT
ncbi:MAG: HAD hydrolase-like protein [Defluviitaleaceae bacterium]|nr:HAD hydrolase-like protein [Defluviitaleaceae bacterium]